jgi:hypothetical protein
MTAPSVFFRELVRVTLPIAALGVFALLFAPVREAEPRADSTGQSAAVRCEEPLELLALGAHSLRDAVRTADVGGR